ncbi:MAG TPA: hypothetical protein VGT05_02600 [Patescibacteria group bacterium]|nr:hypothetical protein [Patescibacteria group bacterium]
MKNIPQENYIIGKCIYCGTVNDSLSREHIVPYGLNGEWILQKASCTRCSDITSKFELSVLKGLLPQARAALKYQTRHGHPKTFPVKMKIAGQWQKFDITPDEYGAIILFPLFRQPAYLDNRSPLQGTLDILGTGMHRLGGTDMSILHKKYNAESIDFRFEFDPGAFLKLLAKVAYGYAVLYYGLDVFDKIYALPIIMGQTDEVDRWIGSEKSSIGNEEVSIVLHQTGKDLIAKIRLFGKREVPTYIVVVGSIK